MEKNTTDIIVSTIEHLCQKRNIRLTKQRKIVIKLLVEAKGAISAYDLLDQLKCIEPQAKPPTIYRALDFLLKQGFIHKVESINCYILCHHFTEQAHTSVLFICQLCKVVNEQFVHNIEAELQALADRYQFQLRHSVVEVHGICKRCQ